MVPLLVPVVLATVLSGPAQHRDGEDWSTSPEAYFLTAEERARWRTLRTAEARAAFVAEYWRRRDPAPGTPRNEFRELVEERIREANERFGIGRTPGARTARGRVFVLLGPPASEHRLDRPSRYVISRPPGGAPADRDQPELHAWRYDRVSTPEALEGAGEESLEIRFLVDPYRTDRLQQASRFARHQERLAQRSILRE